MWMNKKSLRCNNVPQAEFYSDFVEVVLSLKR